MSKELDEAECSKEERLMLAGAKSDVFEFRMLDWYYLKDERELSHSLQADVLTAAELESAFEGPYKHLDDWKARNVAYSLVHVASMPFTNYMQLEARRDVLAKAAGAQVYFIEKQKFFGLSTPEGIEITDFIMASGKVLLLRHDTDRRRKVYSRTGALIDDSGTVASYSAFAETVKGSSTVVDEFLADPRLKLQPERINQECDQCGNDEAWVMYYGIRIGDEPPLIITKCTECGATSRTGVG
jgi:DNA-directed RNA polymerase subunit M/transcription elongation factor TFIIS